MPHELALRETLAAVELDHGEELILRTRSGDTRRLALLGTDASIHSSNLAETGPGPAARVVLRMTAHLEIDGSPVTLVRWVGSQESFYRPWKLFGLRVWFDACQALFQHLAENHGPCRPRKQARFAFQELDRGICPILLHPWCPLPPRGLRIEDCYQGSDCWLGPYFGVDAHGGLDINHPAGTLLWTPIPIDDHGYFESLATGANNNRWRSIHRWPDGSTWILQSHHLVRLLVPEHQPIPAGTLYAESAGVYVGSHEHTHFTFAVVEPGADLDQAIRLDPWILFQQMYADRRRTRAAGRVGRP